jgi:DNA-binding MarR family transcriptional regulator
VEDTRLSVDDIAQLLAVVTRIAEQGQCTPSDAVRRIASAYLSDRGDEERERAALAEFAARWRLLRQRRNEVVGAPLFRDPAWDILLELFAAHNAGRRVSVTSLCLASGVPPTTALRQVQLLEEHQLLTRRDDSADGRRCYIEPTPRAVSAIASMAGMLIAQTRALDNFGDETAVRSGPLQIN